MLSYFSCFYIILIYKINRNKQINYFYHISIHFFNIIFFYLLYIIKRYVCQYSFYFWQLHKIYNLALWRALRFYTSGGFQLSFRLTPKRHHQPFPCGSLGWAALRSRALSRSGTNQAHKLTLEFNLTDYPSAYRKKQKNGS